MWVAFSIYSVIAYGLSWLFFHDEVFRWPIRKSSIIFGLALLLAPISFPFALIAIIAGLRTIHW